MENGTTAHTFDFGLIQTDADGVCRVISPDLQTWIGPPPASALIGQFIFQIFSPEAHRAALEAWERIVATKEHGRFETTIRSSSGALLTVNVELTPARGISALTDHWIVALIPQLEKRSPHEGELGLLKAELSDTRRRSEEQLGALKEEIAQIQRAKDLLLESLQEESRRKIVTLEETIAALRSNTPPTPGERSALATFKAENLTLKRRIQEAEEELGALRQQITQHQDTLARATDERNAAAVAAQELTNLRAELAEHQRSSTATLSELTEARTRIAALEREAAEASQFAQTAAREFKEVRRLHDGIAAQLTSSQAELTRTHALLDEAHRRESELTLTLQRAQNDNLALSQDREAVRREAERLATEARDRSQQLIHSTTEILEHVITEVAARLNRLLRLFYNLPDLTPESSLCLATAAARTAADDLVLSLEYIHEYWLMESGGGALQRENFPLRAWLSRNGSVYEFKAAQRNVTFKTSSDPQIPELVLTDGARFGGAVTQTLDYILEATTPGSAVSFSALVLSATAREVSLAFECAAPRGSTASTVEQQLSLTLAERVIKMLGGDLRVVDLPGESRGITITLTFIRASGTPASLAPRPFRRIARQEIEPLPVRPNRAPFPNDEPSMSAAPLPERDFPTDVDADGMVSLSPRAPYQSTTAPQSLLSERMPDSPAASNYEETPVELTAPVPPTLSAPPEQTAPITAPITPAALRVLLAEDNRLNQRMIGDILRSRGYNIVVAADGREATGHLATASFDLALIDCEMPTMDGYAATREIRRAERGGGRHTPIFGMTVYLDEDIQTRCHDAGMDELLTKPVRGDQLFGLIDRYFPNHRGATVSE